MEENHYLERFMESIQYVGRMMKRNGRNNVASNDITKSQWFILRILSKRPHTIGELAEKLEVRSSSMSQMIDRLELSGLVQRQSNTGDGRIKEVVLSDEGMRGIKDISIKKMEFLSAPFTQLSVDEQEQLVHLLEKVKANLADTMDK
ncbi:MarR family winged helix-turn-helix transcriptional regulator [Lederbergia graminis]|uniref:MarR family winged helix-turn-helix transcriptional regulator n=1 Tax=Lederbergia graminis TaxID=735518 RepID=A0ABW0LIS1_9BACI